MNDTEWEEKFDNLKTFEKTVYGVLGAKVEKYVLIDKDFLRETLRKHDWELIEKIRDLEKIPGDRGANVVYNSALSQVIVLIKNPSKD